MTSICRQEGQRGAAIRITMPYPPSTWDLYTGWGIGRHLSKPYAKWREGAGYFVNRFAGRITGPFSIQIALKRQNRRHDLDNRAKAVLDVLQHYRVIKNDNLCERITMAWDEGMEDECVVLVQPFEGGAA